MKNFSLKKITLLSIVIILAITIAVLPSCSSSSNSDKSPEKTQEEPQESPSYNPISPSNDIYIWWNSDPDSIDIIQRAIYDFGVENPGLGTSIVPHTPASMDRQALEMNFLAGSAPNIVKMNQVDIINLGRSGYLVDLAAPDYNFDKYENLYNSSVWSLIKDRDSIYGLPFDAGTTVMAYNKEIFQELELEIPTTFEDLEYAFDKINGLERDDLYVYGNIFHDISDEMFYILWGMGTDIFTADGRGAAFNSPATAEALTALAEFREKYRLAPVSPVHAFLDGRTAIGMFNQRDLPDMENEKYLLAPLPSFQEGSQPSSQMRINSLGVVRSANKHQNADDLAVKFLEFFATDPNYQAEYCKTKKLTPTLREALQQEPFSQGNYKIFADQLDNGRLKPDIDMLLSSDVKITQYHIDNFLNAIISGEENIHVALTKAEIIVNEKLDEIWEKWDKAALEDEKSNDSDDDSKNNDETPANNQDNEKPINIFIYIIGGLLIILLAGGIFLVFKRRDLKGNLLKYFSRKNTIIVASVAAVSFVLLFGMIAKGFPQKPVSSDDYSKNSAEATGTPKPAPEDNKIIIWWDDDVLSRYLINEAISDFRNDFPQYNDLPIVVQTPDSQYWPDLKESISSGTAPDIVRMNYVFLPELFNKGYIMNLAEPAYGADSLEDLFIEPAWEAVIHDGNVLGLPLDASVMAMAYNKNILKQVGMDVPKNSAELAELLDKVDKLGDEYSGYVYELDLSLLYNPKPIMLFSNLGGSVFSEDLTRSAIDSKDSVNAISKMLDIAKVNGGKDLQNDPRKAFLSGKVAMMEFDPWIIDTILKNDDFVVDTLPEFKKGIAPNSTLALNALVVVSEPRDSDNNFSMSEFYYRKKVAYEFVKYFSTNPKYQVDYNMPRFTLPSLRDALDMAPYNDGTYKVFVEQLNNVIVMPQYDFWKPVEDVLVDTFWTVLHEGQEEDVDIKAALEQAADKINDLISNMYKTRDD